MSAPGKLLALIAACVACNGAGQLLLRLGASTTAPMTTATLWDGRSWIALLARWPVVLGLASWTGSTLLWLVVLGHAELSYAYLIGATNYVLVPLAAACLLGESLPTPRILGMVCILCGVALVVWSGLSTGAPPPGGSR
jgi:drug/metabolite transporter (DMT)-like permease